MIFRRSLVSELANTAGAVFTVIFSIVLTIGLVRILGLAAGGRIDSGTVMEMVVYEALVNLAPLLAVSLFIAVPPSAPFMYTLYSLSTGTDSSQFICST